MSHAHFLARRKRLLKIIGDGVAVVVNPANSTDDLSVDQIKGIYTGELTVWADVQ